MPAYRKLASHVVWKCFKSVCGGGLVSGGWVGGGVESEFSDRLWPRPSQTIIPGLYTLMFGLLSSSLNMGLILIF